MLKILFLGDISGKIGRKAVVSLLPKLNKQYRPDLIIANGENMAHGSGFTKETVKELMDAGIDYFTGGDHSFDKEKQIEELFDHNYPVLRPANFSFNAPGKGFAEIEMNNHKILLINLIGRVFMKMDHDCPFRKLDEILANNDLPKKTYSAIIVDIHAEATAEKVTMGHYADGRVSAVLGTHTHVMTADSKVSSKGMAYISDVGMCGAADECIGVAKEGAIKTFLNQIKTAHVYPEKGRAQLNAVLLTINQKNGKAKKITPIQKFITIK